VPNLLLHILPWLLLGAYFLIRVRLPRPLPEPLKETAEAPFVSVIVPARDEARNIVTCLESLTSAQYPHFEIIVVDDQSEDGTGELARQFPTGAADALRVIEGLPLPGGWLGKPWACQQGGQAALGEIFLFTDADTVHAPDLLSRSVRAHQEEGADVLSLLGRQLLGSFWERLLQPRFFVLLAARFATLRRPYRQEEWQKAIANGQFILMTRKAWEGVGGHGVVRGEVAEDLRLAQALVRRGWTLVFRAAEGSFATRMYRSLGELVAGWSKNLATGSKQAVPAWLRPVAVPAVLVFGLAFWVLPPAALLAVLAGAGGSELRAWALAATSFGVLFWALASARLRVHPLYGFLFPLGALVESYIVFQSWMKGRRVQWKGRTYHLEMGSGEEL
jgi:chlorobactene glucosyltransferase